MVKSTDQKTIAVEKMFCFSLFPRGRGMPCHTRPHREQGEGPVGGTGSKENVSQSLYCGFPGEEQVKQGE